MDNFQPGWSWKGSIAKDRSSLTSPSTIFSHIASFSAKYPWALSIFWAGWNQGSSKWWCRHLSKGKENPEEDAEEDCFSIVAKVESDLAGLETLDKWFSDVVCAAIEPSVAIIDHLLAYQLVSVSVYSLAKKRYPWQHTILLPEFMSPVSFHPETVYPRTLCTVAWWGVSQNQAVQRAWTAFGTRSTPLEQGVVTTHRGWHKRVKGDRPTTQFVSSRWRSMLLIGILRRGKKFSSAWLCGWSVCWITDQPQALDNSKVQKSKCKLHK